MNAATGDECFCFSVVWEIFSASRAESKVSLLTPSKDQQIWRKCNPRSSSFSSLLLGGTNERAANQKRPRDDGDILRATHTEFHSNQQTGRDAHFLALLHHSGAKEYIQITLLLFMQCLRHHVQAGRTTKNEPTRNHRARESTRKSGADGRRYRRFDRKIQPTGR